MTNWPKKLIKASQLRLLKWGKSTLKKSLKCLLGKSTKESQLGQDELKNVLCQPNQMQQWYTWVIYKVHSAKNLNHMIDANV
jgi:hypothetical protein